MKFYDSGLFEDIRQKYAHFDNRVAQYLFHEDYKAFKNLRALDDMWSKLSRLGKNFFKALNSWKKAMQNSNGLWSNECKLIAQPNRLQTHFGGRT